jgi:integration host factor subunit beta
MKKSELVSTLVMQLPMFTTQELRQAVDYITTAMTTGLAEHQRVEIRGFGCLTVRKQPPRRARNPKTGETFITDGGCKVHFKPSIMLNKRLRDSLNK